MPKPIISIAILAILAFSAPAFGQSHSNVHQYVNSAQPRSILAPLLADGAARPVAGVEILIRGGALGSMSAVTDEQGFASIVGPLGVYNVAVTGGEISNGATLVRIELADPQKPGYYLHDNTPEFFRRLGLHANIRFSHPLFEIRVVEQ